MSAVQPTVDAAADRGERARTRLLTTAARTFAEKGYARSSTREICLAAGLNAAAIHYHFGDKAGLYRAVLLVPIERIVAQLADFDDPALDLPAALRRLLGPFVGIGSAGGAVAGEPDDGVRLVMREMVEPTPVFIAAIAQYIGPVHQRMARLLARHIGADGPDEDVHGLVFGLVAMAHDYCLSREFMRAMAPRVLDGDHALERAHERLVRWGAALVAHERRRRGPQQGDPW
jgi:AcrR family transcriptional regulator